MRLSAKMWAVALLATTVAASNAVAVDAPSGQKVLVAKSFRASKLTGLNVRNPAGDKLGTVDDLVINVESGKIAYVAMSVGGVLGVGNKMFAIPFSSLQFDHGKDEMHFVLNMSKEKLEAAPGFDKSNWPDFADPSWSKEVDSYYHAQLQRDRQILTK